MDPAEILAKNHDIHTHSRDFSDGMHPVLDVIRHAARWQDPPRWAGLSDHSPRTEPDMRRYYDQLSDLKRELLNSDGITLQAGMELEWDPSEPAAGGLPLAGLDYVIAAYHGMNFSTAGQVEKYYALVARHPFTDVAAHPDRFLGAVDPLAAGWEKIFSDFSRHKVICEYNLTTPLRAEILAIAIDQTDVHFTIGSDTHDFRDIAVCRIIDAWSEMLGGGYELAYEYLTGLLKLACSARQSEALSRLFAARPLLDDLQSRVYQNSLALEKPVEQFSPEEDLLLKTLADIPECEEDKKFLICRLERFASLPSERIISLQSVDDFKKTIENGRTKRMGAQLQL